MRRLIEIRCPDTERAQLLYREALEAAGEDGTDRSIAYALLVRAREAGSSEAAYALGNWYGHGIHVEKDLHRAHDLFVEAAEGNVPDALFNLGLTYEKGVLGRTDKFLAYRYYLRAALFGDIDSLYEVFRCLHDGVGVPRDRAAAAVWKDAYVARGGDFEAKDSGRL